MKTITGMGLKIMTGAMMTTDAELKQRRAIARAAQERYAARKVVHRRTLRVYGGTLVLTVDDDGRAMLARGERGSGVAPSPWEVLLMERVDELERENAILRGRSV
jgi:hypothetical protein